MRTEILFGSAVDASGAGEVVAVGAMAGVEAVVVFLVMLSITICSHNNCHISTRPYYAMLTANSFVASCRLANPKSATRGFCAGNLLKLVVKCPTPP